MCWCCSLKPGGNIVGVIKIILGAILIIYATVIWGSGDAFPPTGKNPEDNLYGSLFPENANSDVDADAASMRIETSLVLLIGGAMAIIPGILLLRGVAKNSPYLLKIWIITQVVILTLSVLHTLQLAAIHRIYPSSNLILGYVLEVWFMVVVISLRKEFLQERPDGGKYSTFWRKY